MLLTLLQLPIVGCGGYGEVSPTTYEFAKALYSIANRRASESLEPARQKIEAARQQGDLNSREAGWLLEIVGDAERGKWERASNAAREMVADQVHRS
jgi:hypothetical protein